MASQDTHIHPDLPANEPFLDESGRISDGWFTSLKSLSDLAHRNFSTAGLHPPHLEPEEVSDKDNASLFLNPSTRNLEIYIDGERYKVELTLQSGDD